MSPYKKIDKRPLNWLPAWLKIITWIDRLLLCQAVLFLLSCFYRLGFETQGTEQTVLNSILHVTWIAFILHTLYSNVYRLFYSSKDAFTGGGYVLHGLLLLSLIPYIFYRPETDSGVLWLWQFFAHPAYKYVVLTLLSLQFIVRRLMGLLSKRTNPSLVLAGSFFFIILIGTGLLLLPRSTHAGISVIDALFLSTSATCVVGMSTVDLSSTLTPFGWQIVLLLVQVGGIGIMTITSFFALLMLGNGTLTSTVVIADMIGANSLNKLLGTLTRIFGLTLIIEGVGAVLIWLSIHDTLGLPLEEEIWFSVFHSVSAFCNAGFSNYPDGLGHAHILQQHSGFFLSLSVLVILGGIGFPILYNWINLLVYRAKQFYWWLFYRNKKRFMHRTRLYNLNTSLVVWTSCILLVTGTWLIAVLEWNGALSSLSVMDRWVHAFFSSVCTRSAGFSAIGLTDYRLPTLLVMSLFMLIGGGTQSTAGGVKVNVFAVSVLHVWAEMRGVKRIECFGREVDVATVKRANAVLLFYGMLLFTGTLLLSFTETEATLQTLFHECVAAISTAGLSLDITATLSGGGKMVMVLLMFVGRVGAFTLIAGLVEQAREKNYRFPNEGIIIT